MSKKMMVNGISLTLEQEKFCQNFVSEGEFFGNGVQSYISAYAIDLSKKNAYQTARAKASILLTKGNICKRITELIDESGLNDFNVDKQLLIAIQQCADFGSKVRAISEYNNLKSRIKNTEKEPVKVIVEIKQVP
jgi:hypothetical protein